MKLTDRCVWLASVISLCGCQLAGDPETQTSSVEQDGKNLQGKNLQGKNLQGKNLQGKNLQGFQLGGATLAGVGLDNVRVEEGQVVAEQNGVTLYGTALVGANFVGQATDTATPPNTASVAYRITAVTAESAAYDPTHTGSTYLYNLQQQNPDDGTWAAACDPDADGNTVAIPVAAIFDAHGDRSTSTTMFTFGCTSAVIAKCYRWGYRPWVTGYGDLADMHWTCTRMARADYCGDGTPHTFDGTMINNWDTLPAPGPIQQKAGLLQTLGMLFEAGWNHDGAVCLSRARWLLDDGELIANECPDRLVPLGLGATLCDTVAEVLGYDANAKMFNQSYLNITGL